VLLYTIGAGSAVKLVCTTGLSAWQTVLKVTIAATAMPAIRFCVEDVFIDFLILDFFSLKRRTGLPTRISGEFICW
jgi:hypothetical protein